MCKKSAPTHLILVDVEDTVNTFDFIVIISWKFQFPWIRLVNWWMYGMVYILQGVRCQRMAYGG